MTCPRSLGKLEEELTLESAFPTHRHHPDGEPGGRDTWLLGGGCQDSCWTDRGHTTISGVTHPFEKLKDALASSSEKCVVHTGVHTLQGVVGTATTDARVERLEGRWDAGGGQARGLFLVLSP